MRFGCSLPSRTFMPEVARAQPEVGYNPFLILKYGYDAAMKIGYDYIEAAVAVVRDLPADAMQTLVEETKDGSFKLECCNCFVPSTLSLCTAPQEDIEAFVSDAMRKMNLLQVRRVVFGSGGARRCPEGMDVRTARNRIEDFLKLCDKIGGFYGITTIIEPLNSKETNMINSVSEGAQWVRELDLANVRLLADLFHMDMENEDLSVIAENADIILQLHAAEAPQRCYPGKFRSEYIIQCGKMLRTMNLQKEITVECGFDDFGKEGVKALAFLKENF